MNELIVPKRHTPRTEVAALPAKLAFDYSQATGVNQRHRASITNCTPLLTPCFCDTVAAVTKVPIFLTPQCTVPADAVT